LGKLGDRVLFAGPQGFEFSRILHGRLRSPIFLIVFILFPDALLRRSWPKEFLCPAIYWPYDFCAETEDRQLMKFVQALVAGLLLLWIGAAQAQVTYAPFNVPGISVTGIQSNSTTTDDVVISGSYSNSTVTAACPNTVQAALYVGSLAAVATAPFTTWTCFTPNLPAQNVTTSLFYGPNTPIFDSSLGAGNVRVVGSYKFSNNAHPKNDHGLMYEGPIAGCPGSSTSCWTQLDPTSLLKGDEQLTNTI